MICYIENMRNSSPVGNLWFPGNLQNGGKVGFKLELRLRWHGEDLEPRRDFDLSAALKSFVGNGEACSQTPEILHYLT